MAALGPEHRAALLTLTVRHHPAQSLADLLRVVNRAFTMMMNSHYVRALRAQGVHFGHARALEITWNPSSGWHPHVHALVFTPDFAAYNRAWRTRTDSRGQQHGLKVEWLKAVKKASVATGVVPAVAAMARAQDMREAQLEDAGRLAGYMTKDGKRWSVAAEISRQDVKSGRRRSLAPLQLLLAAGDGDRRKQELWRELVDATKGVQRVSFSRQAGSAKAGSSKGTTVADYLAQQLQRYEGIEAGIESGYGDDPRAMANRKAVEAQQAAYWALSAKERREYNERDQTMDAANEPHLEELASFARSEQLSGRDGRMTLGHMHSKGLLFGLLDRIEGDSTGGPPQAVAATYIGEHSLPVDPHGMPRRSRRSIQPREGSWQEYRELRADFEERLTAMDLDEEQEDRLFLRFDYLYKPESTRPYPFRRI